MDLFELLCKVLDQNLFTQVDWARNSYYFKDLKVRFLPYRERVFKKNESWFVCVCVCAHIRKHPRRLPGVGQHGL